MGKTTNKIEVPQLAKLDQDCALRIAEIRIGLRTKARDRVDKEIRRLLLDMGFEETVNQWTKTTSAY